MVSAWAVVLRFMLLQLLASAGTPATAQSLQSFDAANNTATPTLNYSAVRSTSVRCGANRKS